MTLKCLYLLVLSPQEHVLTINEPAPSSLNISTTIVSRTLPGYRCWIGGSRVHFPTVPLSPISRHFSSTESVRPFCTPHQLSRAHHFWPYGALLRQPGRLEIRDDHVRCIAVCSYRCCQIREHRGQEWILQYRTVVEPHMETCPSFCQ